LQNSERLSIAALPRRFRYYKRPAIDATNDGVRIGAKTINDPEVDRGNLNSLLYSASAGDGERENGPRLPVIREVYSGEKWPARITRAPVVYKSIRIRSLIGM
jgi:hypothetical protein